MTSASSPASAATRLARCCRYSACDFAPRSGDDRYILYTGGTTGLPKGVLWRHEDVFFALGGGIDAASGWKAQRPEDMIARGGLMASLKAKEAAK